MAQRSTTPLLDPTPTLDGAVVGLRLRALRQERGVSFAGAAERTGISAAQIVNLEKGVATHLYLHQVDALAYVYNVPTEVVIFGGEARPRTGGEASTQALDVRLRAALRAARHGHGTPALARVAGGTHGSTITRLESGEYRNLDLILFDRLASTLGATLQAWLFGAA